MGEAGFEFLSSMLEIPGIRINGEMDYEKFVGIKIADAETIANIT